MSQAASPNPKVEAIRPPVPARSEDPAQATRQRSLSLSRSATSSRAHLRATQDIPPPLPRSPMGGQLPLSAMEERSQPSAWPGMGHHKSIRRSPSGVVSPPMFPQDRDYRDRVSEDRLPIPRMSKSSRPSIEGQRPRGDFNAPSIPPLNTQNLGMGYDSQPHTAAMSPLYQQRIFIRDKQSFKMMDIHASTRAIDVVDSIAQDGSLYEPRQGSSGGWALFELNAEFGMGKYSAYPSPHPYAPLPSILSR